MVSLVENGCVSARQGEFGADEYALRINAFVWRPLLHARNPVLEFSTLPGDVPMVQHSRLDLLAILHRQGFQPNASPARAWTPEGPLEYRLPNILRVTKLYVVCLVLRESIMERNATEILHECNAQYYRALLSLKSAKDAQALLDAVDRSAESFKRLLGKEGALQDDAPFQALALESRDDAHSDDDSDDENRLPLHLEAYAAQKALLAPHELPVIRAASPLPVVVHFDNCSHQSGVLRGYVKCAWGHRGCFKYQQLNVAGTRSRLIAYLHAWNLIGEGMSREEHANARLCPVPEGLVAQQELALFGRVD
jgi:hypothetical protein